VMEKGARGAYLVGFTSLALYILTLVSRRKWEQHGNSPDPADTHVNSYAHYAYLNYRAEGRLCGAIGAKRRLE